VTFGFREIQWFTNSATYYINENTSDCVGEGAAAQTAANTWNQYSPFVFSYAGTTSSVDYGSNDKNELLWVNYNTGSIASTICWYWPESGQLDECDLIFNNASYLWSTSSTPPADRFDVQSIALHELGHWLKLLDLYGDNDQAKTMYGLKSRGALQRSLSIGIFKESNIFTIQFLTNNLLTLTTAEIPI